MHSYETLHRNAAMFCLIHSSKFRAESLEQNLAKSRIPVESGMDLESFKMLPLYRK